uniref:Carbohydrate kinase FGGY C-terminal domain-containing protein n=1 Tax=Rhodosorus marinus TaxID=101924 RepID=A0A7S2ZHC9_9RHOD|mmetsp:Transcript_19096/g.76567  ORF Transcript_19096/g.76567 Transcript_19096/m.76567 type:complete len:431 (+) Transcript_19096:510-1802(+)|eukprot:CAMPEP_0113961020 /NCGR_PEP_ID=MMETSP0011_2-20120614/5059_1 /TAXON_ID=101924 /ORGANISM="Rhodosorus marinus" /LENGTH=430 /DNA_ID=CAMNT_0000972579 /DNA_START=222 /DNA_END=1514 /DNA_ORIENTATION=+ /assembly_acc=CAM_ASM_000156
MNETSAFVLSCSVNGTGGVGRSYALGIDYGTSGVRGAVLEIGARPLRPIVRQVNLRGVDGAQSWTHALCDLLDEFPSELRGGIRRVAVDGTSASIIYDGAVKMYNHAEPEEVVEKIRQVTPPGHTVASATSSLAKIVGWGATADFEHQADFITRLLLGSQHRTSDWNNALKMGFDPEQEAWPEWLSSLLPLNAFMDVKRPGEVVGNADPTWGFADGCLVVAGTTDSIAAFIASGATKLRESCTSLGSSLALKLLSDVRVDDSKFGIYSHRYFMNSEDGSPLWLVGGASNVGGRTLKELGFSGADIASLSDEMDLNTPLSKDLKLYPLPPGSRGERFPINDPNLAPALERGGTSDVEYLRSLLDSIAEVERRGFTLLEEYGAPYPTVVYSAGGGAYNPTYSKIRERKLGVPVRIGDSTEACVGAALLAEFG